VPRSLFRPTQFDTLHAMSHDQNASGPQFRADRPAEQEAVRTTIVGGRPPGSGQPVGNIPRGIEILLKKAAVDPAFKELLLHDRAAAAETIGLALDPAEAMMLAAAPAAQLEAVIAQTVVPEEHRRAFLGQAAALMVAALGAMTAGCEPIKGVKPDHPPTKGIRPDQPRGNIENAERVHVGGGVRPGLYSRPPRAGSVRDRVIDIVVEQLGLDKKRVTDKANFVKDLGADSLDTVELVMEFEEEFNLNIPDDVAMKIYTVGQAIEYIEKAVTKGSGGEAPPGPTRGIRPDRLPPKKP
jgi:acyl carrier protein